MAVKSFRKKDSDTSVRLRERGSEVL